MKKWEYCQLVVNRATPNNPKSKQLVFLSVDELNIRQIRSISQTIAQLGIDGWELVSHTQSQIVVEDGLGGFPWTEFFTFKRPLA
ncbi:hypothetical protein QUF58_14045 [Anaerolineales bacterium HSG24]|nr:hypothetical protein [Anaerolineales bacterium HSG24]